MPFDYTRKCERRQLNSFKQSSCKLIHQHFENLEPFLSDPDLTDGIYLGASSGIIPDDVYVNKKYKGRKKEFNLYGTSSDQNNDDDEQETTKKDRTIRLYNNKNSMELDENDVILLEKLVGAKYSSCRYRLITIDSKAALFETASDIYKSTCLVKVFKTPSKTDKIIWESADVPAKKEFTGLKKASNCRIPCPQPINHESKIVIMSLVGKWRTQYPRLSEVKLTDEEYSKMYHEMVQSLKIFYKQENMVHGSISETSVFWVDGRWFWTDFSESVDLTHPEAFELLYNDCVNISRIFDHRNVKGVSSASELFLNITGFHFHKDRIKQEKFRKNLMLKLKNNH